jgi:fatty acid kinase fatty acid binding subunit
MIGIITDSTCDIPEALLEQYGIVVVPLTVVWGDQQYRDRVDLTPLEFYQRLARDPQRPTTSVPSIQEFHKAYEQATARGADELVILTLSSAMSGVHQLAASFASELKIPTEVIDARGPTMSLGWQALAAARARDAGAGLREIVDEVEQVRRRLALFVSLDTLDYLRQGGRIGEAMKWMGVKLHVRPVILVDHESGKVGPVGLARTHKSGVDSMFDRFADSLKGLRDLHIAVLHGNAPQEAEALAERVRSALKPSELLINMTGPVLGVNTGPGALALCGYGTD